MWLPSVCNCNCNLFRIQSDPDTGWKMKFNKPLDIECVLKSIREMFQWHAWCMTYQNYRVWYCMTLFDTPDSCMMEIKTCLIFSRGVSFIECLSCRFERVLRCSTLPVILELFSVAWTWWTNKVYVILLTHIAIFRHCRKWKVIITKINN
jgi:hypothetical protein